MLNSRLTLPRRTALLGLPTLLIALIATAFSTSSRADHRSEPPDDLAPMLKALEHDYSARVGISYREIGTGRTASYRDDERFGFASTLKAFAAALLLATTTDDERDEPVHWSPEDVVAAGYSPVTEQATSGGLTLGELAEAAVRQSDNAAMNMMLDRLGGPDGLRDALEARGDHTTRPVDEEPALNEIVPGSDDNTSTPEALAQNLEGIADGSWLTRADTRTLMDWMSGNPTGDTLIRAGAPEEWEVLEKSGGAGGLRHDVAILRTPEREQIVLVVLTEALDPSDGYDDALVADATRAVMSHMGRDC